MAASSSVILPREVLKWLQSLDLSFSIRNLRRDFTNGFLVAEILAKYYPHDVQMHAFENGTGTACRKANWNMIIRMIKKQHSTSPITLSDSLLLDMRNSTVPAVVPFLLELYQTLTQTRLDPISIGENNNLPDDSKELPSDSLVSQTASTTNAKAGPRVTIARMNDAIELALPTASAQEAMAKNHEQQQIWMDEQLRLQNLDVEGWISNQIGADKNINHLHLVSSPKYLSKILSSIDEKRDDFIKCLNQSSEVFESFLNGMLQLSNNEDVTVRNGVKQLMEKCAAAFMNVYPSQTVDLLIQTVGGYLSDRLTQFRNQNELVTFKVAAIDLIQLMILFAPKKPQDQAHFLNRLLSRISSCNNNHINPVQPNNEIHQSDGVNEANIPSLSSEPQQTQSSSSPLATDEAVMALCLAIDQDLVDLSQDQLASASMVLAASGLERLRSAETQVLCLYILARVSQRATQTKKLFNIIGHLLSHPIPSSSLLRKMYIVLLCCCLERISLNNPLSKKVESAFENLLTSSKSDVQILGLLASGACLASHPATIKSYCSVLFSLNDTELALLLASEEEKDINQERRASLAAGRAVPDSEAALVSMAAVSLDIMNLIHQRFMVLHSHWDAMPVLKELEGIILAEAPQRLNKRQLRLLYSLLRALNFRKRQIVVINMKNNLSESAAIARDAAAIFSSLRDYIYVALGSSPSCTDGCTTAVAILNEFMAICPKEVIQTFPALLVMLSFLFSSALLDCQKVVAGYLAMLMDQGEHHRGADGEQSVVSAVRMLVVNLARNYPSVVDGSDQAKALMMKLQFEA